MEEKRPPPRLAAGWADGSVDASSVTWERAALAGGVGIEAAPAAKGVAVRKGITHCWMRTEVMVLGCGVRGEVWWGGRGDEGFGRFMIDLFDARYTVMGILFERVECYTKA